MSILEKLYYEWYELHAPYRAEDKEIHLRYDEAWEKVDELLENELAEELRSSFLDYMFAETCHVFQDGVCLGAQLMLELQSPVTG